MLQHSVITELPIQPPRRARPTHSAPHYFATSAPGICSPTQKHDPSFSVPCALRLIRDSVYPSCFLRSAHSLPETSGHRGSSSLNISEISLTSMESNCFTNVPSKPFRILLFRTTGTGRVAPCHQTTVSHFGTAHSRYRRSELTGSCIAFSTY